MKYIDAERLRTEIKRRKEEYKEDRYMSDYRGQIAYYKDEIYDDLLSFIDYLQQEQQEEPVSENLEEEIDRVIADYAFTKTINSGGFKTTVLDYAKIARHFFKLGRNARKEE